MTLWLLYEVCQAKSKTWTALTANAVLGKYSKKMSDSCRTAILEGGVPHGWGPEVACSDKAAVEALRLSSANRDKGIFWNSGLKKCRVLQNQKQVRAARIAWTEQKYSKYR